MLACIFGDGYFFLSLSKLVGEPVPLPMPRKANTCKISASEHPKAPKRKVVPPLPPPRTLSMERDQINSLSRERANSEHITRETHCCTSNTENILEDDLVRHIKQERTHSKSKVDSASSNEDQTVPTEETKIDDSVSSNSSPNHKVENNFELPNFNCMEPVLINQEAHFESEDKFLTKDKFDNNEKVLDIADNLEDHELLNLSQHLSNEENTGLHSDSIELNVSQENLLLERNVIPKEEENILQQDCKTTSKNIDFCDENENQDDKSYMLSNDNSLNKNMTKSGIIELKSEQLKPSYHQSACQRPPRAPRKRITSDEIEKTVETEKHLRPKDATSGTEIKSGLEKNKETCTVISTIPKCDHFDVIREDDTLNSIIKYNIAENANETCQKLRTGQDEESNNMKNAKRTKVIRSQSKSDDFEMDILKRQKRYFTSPPEDIVHALNLNFSTGNSTSSSALQSTEQEQINAGHCINHTRDVDVNERVTGACHYITNYFSILILILCKFVTFSI